MTDLRERIEKILAQVLMKHHDDISKQDDNAIAEATDQILQVILEVLPKEYEDVEKSEANEEIKEYMRGYNICLAQIRERIGER